MEARGWINKLAKFLDLSYPTGETRRFVEGTKAYVMGAFPPSTHSSLLLLPTGYLSSEPLYELLEGFKTDLEFSKTESPIISEDDLSLYSSRVAGTVAELCLGLIFHHSPSKNLLTAGQRDFLIKSGGRMGIALQYVNIARDVATDAKLDRVYLPTLWLKEENLTTADVVKAPREKRVECLRNRLLGKAFQVYEEARSSMNHLPCEARAPLKVAVESYMEIGRCMREKGYSSGSESGRATVPRGRRVWTAWKTLCEG